MIDTDGTIYQLVNLRVRCRHAIGMNWTAIGIEHVGTSDETEILSSPAMMRASLRLTLWLMAGSEIQACNVIGHAETLMSPFHHEAYPTWRCWTHADWQHADMLLYRERLRRLAHRTGGPDRAPACLGRPRLLSPPEGRSFALARSGDASESCPRYDAPVRLLRSPDFRLLALSNGLSSLGTSSRWWL